MNENFLKQLFAELIDAQQQANTVLANAIGDVIGRPALAAALERRLTTAKAAASHPMRDSLLATALAALRAP